MKTGEAKVKDDVKKYLTSIGAYFFMPVQTGYGQATLDFLVCWRGQFWGIECKAPSRKGAIPTRRQELIMAKIIDAQGHAIVVDGTAELKRWID